MFVRQGLPIRRRGRHLLAARLLLLRRATARRGSQHEPVRELSRSAFGDAKLLCQRPPAHAEDQRRMAAHRRRAGGRRLCERFEVLLVVSPADGDHPSSQVVMPGTHRANLPLPSNTLDDETMFEHAVHVEMSAGDVLFFMGGAGEGPNDCLSPSAFPDARRCCGRQCATERCRGGGARRAAQ